MHYINDPRPWTEGVDRELTMVDLVLNETIPADSAAMLWWALEQGASILTAGGPSGAGKSTLANACLGFLPDGARAYAVAGSDDHLLVPVDGRPTYLLISELSRHGRPHYIWGPAARRTFALLRNGLRVVGTLHADSVVEAIEALRADIELSADDVAFVDLIVVTRVDGWTASGQRSFRRVETGGAPVRRRIVEIGLLGPDRDRGVRSVALASWNARSGRLEMTNPPAGVAAVARWAGVPTQVAEEAIAHRADVLTRLAAEGRRDPGEVGDAVRLLRVA